MKEQDRTKESTINKPVEMHHQITESEKLQTKLNETEEALSLIYEHSPEGIVVLDRKYRITYANSKVEEISGIPFSRLKDNVCFKIIMKREKPCKGCKVDEVIDTNKTQVCIKHEITASGKDNWLQQIWYPILDKDRKVESVVEIVKDITEQKKGEEKLEQLTKDLLKSNKRLKQLVLLDSHTGLYNHRYLADAIEAEFHRAKRYAHPFSLMMIDVDYFKSINDVYGHLFGDLVLKQLSGQLKRMVRRYDIVIRFGGEEFMIISPNIYRSGALKLAQRILDTINLYNFGDKSHTVKLKLSIAVASYPEDKIMKGIDLVEITDQILNKVKEYGGNNIYSSLDIKKKIPSSSRKPEIDIGFLKDKIDKLTKRTNQSLIEAVFAFAKTIELKDQYTGTHVEKTVQYATEVARALNLPDDETDHIKQAAILHDLGKIGIAEKILVKKLKLTREEFEEIKKHPQIGVDIIRPVKFLHNIIPIILYHHERWDGKGYPNGLKGEEIPMGARVVAIADVYQALTSNRPYHKAYSEEEALKIIKNGSGTQFDPTVVIKFVQIIQQTKQIK